AVGEAAETGHDGGESRLVAAGHEVLARLTVGAPLRRHPGEIVNEEIGGGAEIVGASRAVSVRAVLEVVVGRRAIAVAGPGAVQILAPQQELDGVVAGGDIGLDAARLLK